MTAPAERMRIMRERRRRRGLRELRLVVPNPRLQSELDRGSEDEALSFIEAMSEFDATNPSDR